MFGKLMKYEWKDCMRVFLPLWGAMLALAAMNGFTIGVDLKIRNGWLEFFVHILPVLLLFALSFGMFVVAFVLIIRRFYNGLLGEGGYLAFSLPVTVGEHIAAKLLTALIMNIGCVLAGLLSSVLLLSIRGYLPEMKELLQAISRELSSYRHTGLVITEGILLMILLCTYSTLRLYAGMAIGHLFSNHRGAAIPQKHGEGKIISLLQNEARSGSLSENLVNLLIGHYDSIKEWREEESMEASRKYQESLASR